MKKYIIGLNGIRAIAVFLVIISHRFPQNHILNSFPIGSYGVDIFFVLSGFLISRGLFSQLKSQNSTHITNVQILKEFFLKRFLRIFPVYYTLLLFLYFTKGIIGNNFRENILWYLFYGANYLNYFENKWFGALAHLWSLSVEEQFYICFPFLLLFVFNKRILLLLFIFVIVGTFYPYFIDGNSSILTLSCVNAFGIGGLLAYVEIYKDSFVFKFYKYTLLLSVASLLLLILHHCYSPFPFFPERLVISIIAVFVITLCFFKPNSFFVKKILGNRFLNFIGIISYGIYLFHNIVPKYWNYALMKLKISFNNFQFSYLEFFLQTTFIIVLSYFSWILLEKPILNFKKNFK